MARKKKQEVSDESAQDALRYGGKSGAVPAHDAMRPDEDPEEDEDLDTDDAEDIDWDEDREH